MLIENHWKFELYQIWLSANKEPLDNFDTMFQTLFAIYRK